jgi:uncharacterized cupredoxin-like copper-binding protein
MMVWGGPWPALLLVVLVGVAAVLVALRVGGGGGVGPDPGEARRILRRRLASGEIDEREYRERVELLTEEDGAGSSSARWVPTAVVGLVAVLALGLLLVAVVGPGGWWGPGGGHMEGMMGQRSADAPTGSDTPAPVPDADVVTVEAGEMWFDPATLEVTAGEPVNLTVDNRGDAFHDLTVDELDLRIEVAAGESGTAGLEIDDPGEYAFYCSVPGHASAGMRGTLHVDTPS